MKRHVGAALLSAALLTLVSGCGGEAAPQERPGGFDAPVYEWESEPQETLALWTSSKETDRVYMQRAFERYRELTGSAVEIVSFPKGDYVQAMQAAFAAGSGPDLLLSYGGTNIESLAPDENFYDFSRAPWVGDLTATSINQTIYNGKVIGLPHWEASVSGTIYNKKLFSRLNLEVPKTQEEFLAACEVLKENGVTPVYLPYAEISMLLYQFPLDAIVEEPGVLDGLNDGSLHYADLPEMRKVVEWYRTMADRGYFGENYQQNVWDGMNGAMDSESCAMMLCWDTWLYTDFKGDPSRFGLMPAFVGVPEEGTFEGPNLGLLIVNRNSPRLPAALNFITFLADPYNYNAAFADIYTAPVFKNQAASISTPQYVEAERLIERNFRDSTAWLRVRGFSQMDAACIQEYMAGGCTVEECLAEMDKLRAERAFG